MLTLSSKKGVITSKTCTKLPHSIQHKTASLCFSPADRNNASVLNFDAAQYIGQFQGFDITEEQKLEVLSALWDIMSRFVELGYGLNSYSSPKQTNGQTSKDGEL